MTGNLRILCSKNREAASKIDKSGERVSTSTDICSLTFAGNFGVLVYLPFIISLRQSTSEIIPTKAPDASITGAPDILFLVSTSITWSIVSSGLKVIKLILMYSLTRICGIGAFLGSAILTP